MQYVYTELKRIGIFIAHQLISTIGVIVLSGFLIFSIYSIIGVWNPAFTPGRASAVLTEVRGFPVQAVLGLAMGFAIGRFLRHRAMLWVWILPLAIFSSYAILSASRNGPSLLAHFFGNGCSPVNRCFDQVAFTLPFIVSITYALGALLANRVAASRTRIEKT